MAKNIGIDTASGHDYTIYTMNHRTHDCGISGGVQIPTICAACRIAELESQLAALTWTPISESNLPKVGDEVGCYSQFLGVWTSAPVIKDWPGMVSTGAWTHLRSLNPPSPERSANGNR